MTPEAQAVDVLGIAPWVKSMLGEVPEVRDSKAIHCPVLGTHVLSPHEIAILDTPLLQRLRYISQTGFVYLTFPGARHSRLEHTLGTVILAERYAQAINLRVTDRGGSIDERSRKELRMAALLHDVGHSFFSHCSELIYEGEPVFRQLKNEPNLSDAAAHEAVAYMILRSQPFKDFFADVCSRYRVDLNLDRIAGWIVGMADEPALSYLAEVINGPFDVDKLDYVHRDAHATGLRIVVDLDRFFYAVDTVQLPDGNPHGLRPGTHLALHWVQPLEQLAFSKMILYSTVYHHHKVKACDCLLAGAIAWARENGTPMGCALWDHAGFLRLTEGEVLTDRGNPLADRLRNRNLTYRAAEISVNTVEGWLDSESKRGALQQAEVNPSIYSLSKHLWHSKDPAQSQRELNRQVYDMLPEKVKGSVLPEEVWVDLPTLPRLTEVSHALVLMGGNPIPADQVFPTEGWLNAYSAFRHTGHVFSPRHAVREVFNAAQEVLADRFLVRLKRDEVEEFCHWPRPSKEDSPPPPQ